MALDDAPRCLDAVDAARHQQILQDDMRAPFVEMAEHLLT
jgi:hypothetical protein